MAATVHLRKVEEDSDSVAYVYARDLSVDEESDRGILRLDKRTGEIEEIQYPCAGPHSFNMWRARAKMLQLWEKGAFPETAVWQS